MAVVCTHTRSQCELHRPCVSWVPRRRGPERIQSVRLFSVTEPLQCDVSGFHPFPLRIDFTS